MRTVCTGALAMALVLATGGIAVAERTLEVSVVMDAPVEQVWRDYTTAEGWMRWAVPKADMDFRNGGKARTTYDPNVVLGEEGTITHHILAHEPMRMVASRFEAPKNAPQAKIAEQTWGVANFEPIGEKRTRVTLTSYGWGEGGEWDTAYEFFKHGNAFVLNNWKSLYDGAANERESARVMELVGGLAGGEWITETTLPSGALFRCRNVLRFAPDGKSLTGDSWLGGEAGMFYHGATLVWRQPVSGEVRFQSIDQSGAVSSGTLSLEGESTVVWDWNQVSGNGASANYRIEMPFDGKDEYRFFLRPRQENGTYAEVKGMAFRRVEKAPAEYTKLAGGKSD